jgi:hypothetical protein
MGRRQAGILAGTLAVGLCAPATAAASDFYVSKPPGSSDANPCTQAQPCATIQHAVGLAGAFGDTVHVGPGLYQEGVSTGLKNVTLLGAGPGDPDGFNPSTDTFIRPDSNAEALRMYGGGTVRGFRLEGSSVPPAVDNKPGLLLSAIGAGGTLNDTVEDVISTGGEDSGLRENGIQIDDGGTGRTLRAAVSNSRVNFQGGLAVAVTGPNVSTVLTDSSLVPLAAQKQTGLIVSGGASAVMSRSRIGDNFGLAFGVVVEDAGSSVGFIRSTVRVQGTALWVLTGAGTTRATALDSEFVNLTAGPVAGAGVFVKNTSPVAGSHAIFTARSTTIVARGAVSNQLAALALDGPTVAGSSAEANLQNSVARGIDTDSAPNDFDVLSANIGVVNADHSSFTDVSASADSTVTPPGTAGNVTGDPGFVSPPAQDYSLGLGSALVDAGSPAFTTPVELDLDGNVRSLDGNGDCTTASDIGAHERPAVACPPPAQGGAGSAQATTAAGSAATPPDLVAATISGFGVERRRFAVGANATAVAAAKRRRAPKGTAFRYTLSESASVRIAIERKTPGLRSGKRCLKPTARLRRRKARRCTRYAAAGALTRAAETGANRTPFSGRIGRRALRPGRYRATITATDAAGNVSAPRKASFTIVRR